MTEVVCSENLNGALDVLMFAFAFGGGCRCNHERSCISPAGVECGFDLIKFSRLRFLHYPAGQWGQRWGGGIEELVRRSILTA